MIDDGDEGGVGLLPVLPHHRRVAHHARPVALLVAVQDQELQRRVRHLRPLRQQRVHVLPAPRLHQHADQRLVVVVRRLDGRRPPHLVQHGVGARELVAARVEVDQRVIEEGGARQARQRERLHEAHALLQLLAESADDNQPRVGGGVGADALLQHVRVDLHGVREAVRVARRHQHRLVRVLVRLRLVLRRPALATRVVGARCTTRCITTSRCTAITTRSSITTSR